MTGIIKRIGKSEISTDWISSLLDNFIPKDVNIEGKTVSQLINSAAKKSFLISTGAAIPPGLLGWTTILPEVITITKIQFNLIYAIAKFYNKTENFNVTMISIIFANVLGVELGKEILRKAGANIVVSKLSRELLKPTLKKISVVTLKKLLAKLPGRWVPLITAPIFGAMSYAGTKALGAVADNYFSKKIEFAEPETAAVPVQ